MKLPAVVLAAALVLCTACAVCADTATTDDELKLAQLANATHARELYLAGEAASKKGDLQTAIWDWSQALTLKPESTYTAKCLADARDKLYKQYMGTISAKSDAKDPLTALAKLGQILPLMPDNKQLAERAAKLTAGLTDDQAKALAAYQDGWNLMAVKDYPRALESFTSAQTFARGSTCIDDALKQINDFKRAHAELFPQVASSGERLPQLVFVSTTWCHWCVKMKPIIDEVQTQFQGKLAVYRIDGDNKEAKRAYGVTGFPTTIYLDSKGKEVDRIAGATEGSRPSVHRQTGGQVGRTAVTPPSGSGNVCGCGVSLSPIGPLQTVRRDSPSSPTTAFALWVTRRPPERTR